jgi:hypothetical protein
MERNSLSGSRVITGLISLLSAGTSSGCAKESIIMERNCFFLSTIFNKENLIIFAPHKALVR